MQNYCKSIKQVKNLKIFYQFEKNIHTNIIFRISLQSEHYCVAKKGKKSELKNKLIIKCNFIKKKKKNHCGKILILKYKKDIVFDFLYFCNEKFFDLLFYQNQYTYRTFSLIYLSFFFTKIVGK